MHSIDFRSLGACLALISWASAATKPNIVFILADDVGFGDLSCYGATKIRTPALDQLAAEGCRFTDAHTTASSCTPSRFSLLTGQYAWRHAPGSRILPGDAPLCIPTSAFTLPKMFRKAGYATGLVGKWHLGLGSAPKTNYNTALKPGPLEVGFDSAFFIPATGDRVPCVYVGNHHVIGLDPADPITINSAVKRGAPGTFVHGIPRLGTMTGGTTALWNDQDMADTLAKEAIKFVEDNQAVPFFLYFATHGIHVPRVPHPRFKGTSQSGVRGDQIHELDATVGKLIDALDRLKLTQNTMVVFSSDNGGILDTNGPDEVNSGNELTANGHQPNGHLRGSKSTIYEGGHRVPFIVRWPSNIRAGTTSDTLFSLIDMPASFAALTGVHLPAGAAPDSLNALPVLLNPTDAKPVREHLVVHNGGTAGPFGLRSGQWKLVMTTNRTRRKGPANAELYHLPTDPGELHNLAAENPGKVNEMKEILATIRKQPEASPPP